MICSCQDPPPGSGCAAGNVFIKLRVLKGAGHADSEKPRDIFSFYAAEFIKTASGIPG